MKRKANGQGTITKTGTGYRAYITTPAGRITKRFKTKPDAVKWIAEQTVAIEQNTFVAPNKTTFGELLEYCLTACNRRKRTVNRYRQTAAHLGAIMNIPLQKIAVLHLARVLGTAPTPDAKLKIYNLMSVVLNTAQRLDIISRNPLKAIDRPRVNHKEITIFTQDEVRHLLNTIRHSQYYSKYYPFFLLAVTSGCRLSELLGLKINHVKPNYIEVHTQLYHDKNGFTDEPPKTKAGKRIVSVPPFVIDAIKGFYFTEPLVLGGYVFHTKNGTPITANNIEKIWRRVQIEAGIPHHEFHSLRHTHATELLNAKVPIKEVSARLGHERTSTTLNMYVHLIKDYDFTDTLITLYANM